MDICVCSSKLGSLLIIVSVNGDGAEAAKHGTTVTMEGEEGSLVRTIPLWMKLLCSGKRAL